MVPWVSDAVLFLAPVLQPRALALPRCPAPQLLQKLRPPLRAGSARCTEPLVAFKVLHLLGREVQVASVVAMPATILLAILRAISKLLARETNPPLAVGKAMRKHALVE